MFQSKLFAAREYKQKHSHHPPQPAHSNRSFSSYLGATTNDTTDQPPPQQQEPTTGQSDGKKQVAVDTTKQPLTSKQAIYHPPSAASYYFQSSSRSHQPPPNSTTAAATTTTNVNTLQQPPDVVVKQHHHSHQRPLSDLNHSFTSFYLYRNHNHRVVAARPFVQESYQSIIQKNCSTIATVGTSHNDDENDTTKSGKDANQNDSTVSRSNRSMTNTSQQSSHHHHSNIAISYLQEAPTQSTESADSSTSSSDHHPSTNEGVDVSFGDRSSFWNEWAEELIHKEEVEYNQIRQSVSPESAKSNPKKNDDEDDLVEYTETPIVKTYPESVPDQERPDHTSLTMEQVDVSVAFDDPTIALVDETPDNSFVDGNSIGEDLPMHSGTGSIASTSQLLKVPPKTLSTQDLALQNTTSTKNGMMVVPYPSALMVMSKNVNDSAEDDDEMPEQANATRTTVVDNVPEAFAKKTGRDLATPVEKGNETNIATNELEDNETTPKVSGSRFITVDTLATACPLPNDDEDDDTVELVSPMKSVMTEAPEYVRDNGIADAEDEEMSIIQNTSISTLAAMNISQATIQLPTLTVFQQAMEYSTMATDYVQRKQYLLAMEYFQRAIDCYLMNHKSPLDTAQRSPRLSVLSAVNIAGCYRNMGTVARLMERYDEVTTYLCKAEEYYTLGRETVEIRSCESIVTLDGRLLNESTSMNATNQQNTTCSYYTSAEDETMCLDGMILETIQSRAYYHTKYQDDKEQAVECHEQCLKHLLHIYKVRGWNVTKDEVESPNRTQDDEPVREQGVAFVPLSKEHHTSLLVKSLEALGSLYRSLVATSSTKACMILFEDAIDILQCRLEQDESTNDDLIKSVSLILRYLSEIYFERQELDKAVDALHDSTAIKLTASGEPCSEALEVMDKMGAAHEQMENYDKALSCYEQTLFARCRFYGNTHFYVAKSLVNVARVTEMKDGSTQESVELYKAANGIFALHMLSDSPSLDKDVENILQLIPTVIRQGRYEKAISDLNLCLAMADEDTSSEIKIDKAQIYFDLGRAYLGIKDYKLATTALTNAMKETGDVKDEEIFTLLQRVEFLQREEQNRSSKPNDLTNGAALKQSNTSALSLSYVPDPTLSFHDITFQLQGERSLYILDDPKDKVTNQEKVVQKFNDPLSDILYQSFIKETEGPDATAPTIASVPIPPVQDKTPLHTRIRIKLAKKVAKLVAVLRAKCQNSERLRNLKEFSKQCLKACKSKLRMGPQPSTTQMNRNVGPSRSEFNNEDVVYASFEEPPPSKFKLAVTSIVSKCGLNGSSIMASSAEHRSRNTPFSFVHHHVIITEEEDGGFGCQLIHS